MKSKFLWFALLSLIIFLGINSDRIVEFSRFLTAKQKWYNHELSNYQFYQIGPKAMGFPPHDLEVLVKEGTIDSVFWQHDKYSSIDQALLQDLAFRNAVTIPGAFNIIRRQIWKANRIIKIEYDPQYGFPTEVHIDPTRELFDEEIFLFIKNFQQLE